MGRTAVMLVAAVLATNACVDSHPATAPRSATPEGIRRLIVDGAHGGNPRFFFLEPLSDYADDAGSFDAELSPTVTICLLDDARAACTGAPIVTFTRTSGPDGEVVRVDGSKYKVNWHASRFTLADGHVYRIVVSVAGAQLGVADVLVSRNGESRNNSSNSDAITVMNGDRTLPIAFRIDVGLVTTVSLSPGEATLSTGATQQFVATAYDAHGVMIVGRAVTWTSSNPSIVTVSSTGQATAVSAGSAVVSATIDGMVGSANLTVSQPFVRGVLAAGWYHTCRVSNTGAAYCWGEGSSGQLGNGASTRSPVQVAVSMSGMQGRVFASVSAGSYHSCGLTRDGTVYCWGSNDFGELGDGTTTSSNVPVQVQGGPFAFLASGSRNSCAIDTAGLLFCWGANVMGQLAIGSSDQGAHPLPTLVDAPNPLHFSSVALNGVAILNGEAVICGVSTGGAAYCWGAFNEKYLGTVNLTAPATCAGITCALRPSRVDLNLPVTDVIVGGVQGCALVSGGDAYCWGTNLLGALGSGSTPMPTCGGDPFTGGVGPCSPTPIRVASSTPFARLGQGFNFACALSTTGAGYCWGDDSYGQLGTIASESCFGGRAPCATAPIPMNTAVRFKLLASGVYHGCGLGTDDIVYCWGTSYDGELGDGTVSSTPRYTPTAIR